MIAWFVLRPLFLGLLLVVLSWCSPANAQPSGSGWQQCATGLFSACDVQPSDKLRQIVTWVSAWDGNACTYGEPAEATGVLVSPGQPYYYSLYVWNYCTQTGGGDSNPPVLAAYIRNLQSEPEPGEYQCTATICPADAIYLGWAVVLTWALAWGIGRLMVFAASPDD